MFHFRSEITWKLGKGITMPRTRKQSAELRNKNKKEAVRQKRNAKTSNERKAPTLPATTSLVPHNEVFSGLNYTDILSGEVPIDLMDYISIKLKTQYQVKHGLSTLSYLYAKVCALEELSNSETIPVGVFGIQMHYIHGHYLMSCQKPPHIYIIDSLRNSAHKTQVLPQLKILYSSVKTGCVQPSDIQYIVPNSQGFSVDCAPFTVANTVTILNHLDLFTVEFDQIQLRPHIFQCLYNGRFSSFPDKEKSGKRSLSQDQHSCIDEKRKKRQARDRERKRLLRSNDQYRYQEAERVKKRTEKTSDDKFMLREAERKKKGIQKRRLDKEYRQQEAERKKEANRKRRLDKEYRQNEAEREKEATKKRRQDQAYRQKEAEREKEATKKRRQDQEYRQKEAERKKEATKKRRQDQEYRQKEAERKKEANRKKRLDKEYRQKEAEREKEATKKRRQDQEYRQKEAERKKEATKKRRLDKEYRQKEAEREKEATKKRRQDQEYRQKEAERKKEANRKKRLDKEYRQKEAEREKEATKKRRRDQEYRQKEAERKKEANRKKRLDKEYRQKEAEREKESTKKRRLDKTHKTVEAEADKRRRRKKRANKEYRQREAERERDCTKKRRLKAKDSNISVLIKNFHKTVSDGPIYICTSCNQLFYQHSVVSLSGRKGIIHERLPLRQSVAGKVWICRTCKAHISKGKVPPTSVLNGMQFPDQGILKELNPLELTLLAVRLPFMKIHQAPRGKQKKIRGNMVLVPADVSHTVTQLPRLPSETATIKATLKRRLSYKHHVYSLNVRPQKIRKAAKFLSTAPLYKDSITFDTDWDFDQRHVDVTNSHADSTESEENENRGTGADEQTQKEDQWSEVDETEWISGQADTMLTAQDFIEANEREMIYNFAPGERRVPISIFMEKDSEEQAFPGIFCGQRRSEMNERKVKVSYGEIVKSELRNADRRAAMNIENIFFKTKKIQMKTLIDQCQLALRKIKTKDDSLTVKDVKGPAVRNLIHQDKAYKFLAQIRGSPPYFEKISKDLFAMIRQLGPATFFITLSAAETRWLHLLRILGQVIDQKTYSNEELESMSWDDKCRLIQADPITCARHFDFCVSKLLKDVLLNSNIKGKIIDYFFRVEYQQRGSPHIHMMVWCEDAPIYGETSDVDVCDFINKYVTCRNHQEEDNEMKDLTSLQNHRHSSTCKKKREKSCRFGYPKPPLQYTTILHPLTEPEFTNRERQKYKHIYKDVEKLLYEIEETNPELTFQEFLQKCHLSEDEYILSIRSSISTPTVMLKRTLKETRTNNYNTSILQAWRANIDIQFILDVYACATYVASYITKTHRGMSELLWKTAEEVKAGNATLKEQIRSVGNRFLNAVEISAQEAAYICLQLPMKRSSRQIVFVNTSAPQERVALIKSQCILDKMDDHDNDIECSNDISRYANRPKYMDNVTLAEFVASYEMKSSSSNTQTASLIDSNFLQEHPLCENEDQPENNDSQPQNRSDEQQYRRRQHARIIRPVHFNPNSDTEKYYRELIMLYFPWRDEECLKRECETYCERYQVIKDTIVQHRQKYEPYSEQVDMAEQYLQETVHQEDRWDQLASENQQIQEEDINNQTETVDAGIEDPDIAHDLGIPISTVEDNLPVYNEMSDEDYRSHMRLLTPKQIEFVYDIIRHIKSSSEPLYRFLSGGAGVGKSFVTKALYQTALKFLNSRSGEDYTTRRVLVLAPTGKAAYHIKGTTVHSGLKIPPNQSLNYKALASGTLNTLRNEIGSVKLMFIDEISMVGFKMFNFINQRMMEVMQSPLPFGGLSVIAVGDLFQLKPVMDSYIFSQPSSGYLPLASNLWTELFNMVELSDIMRQSDNVEFAKILNRLREGNHTPDDIRTLERRVIHSSSLDYPSEAPHLFATNESVNSFNDQVISQSETEKRSIIAKDIVVGSTPPALRTKILNSFKNSSHSKQLQSTLVLCEDLWYDLTVNLDTQDGLINGASCIIKMIDIPVDKTDPCGRVWVQFIDKETGSSLRSSNRHLYRRRFDKNWTPIEPIVKQYPAGHKGQATVQRVQFPLRPAHAKTIHRSQGDTLPTAVIDLTTKRKIDHLHYVALSRLTSINGLYILNLQQDKISVSQEVKQEMQRLRASKTEEQHSFVTSPCTFKIIYLNCRSLNRHMEDVLKDWNIKHSSVACFSETRFCDRDQLDQTALHDFYQYRQDSKSHTASRPFHGLAIHSTSAFELKLNLNANGVEVTLFKVSKQPDITFVSLYKPPCVQVHELCNVLIEVHRSHLLSSQAVILGDFNIDWASSNPQKLVLQNLLVNKLGYQQTIKTSTTDYGSTLDLIFHNLDQDVICGTQEVYFSDHKIIWLAC